MTRVASPCFGFESLAEACFFAVPNPCPSQYTPASPRSWFDTGLESNCGSYFSNSDPETSRIAKSESPTVLAARFSRTIGLSDSIVLAAELQTSVSGSPGFKTASQSDLWQLQTDSSTGLILLVAASICTAVQEAVCNAFYLVSLIVLLFLEYGARRPYCNSFVPAQSTWAALLSSFAFPSLSILSSHATRWSPATSNLSLSCLFC